MVFNGYCPPEEEEERRYKAKEDLSHAGAVVDLPHPSVVQVGLDRTLKLRN